MIIDCIKCSTSFNLDESLLKPTGSKVRCSKCAEVFVAYPPTPPEEPETPAEVEFDAEPEEADELDLSGIEEVLDEAEAPVTEDAAAEADEELDLDLDFDLEPEPETAAAEAALDAEPEETDELDLSDIEEMLYEAEAPVAEDKVEEADEELDLDLDFDLEPEPETAVAESALDAEPDTSDELDLSDIEKMLDEAKVPVAEDKVEEVDEELDLDLDFDLEPEPETATADVEPDVEPAASDELDLSDIEKMLDEAEAPVAEDTVEEAVEELDLDLDFDLEPEPAKPAEKVQLDAKPDEADEIDLSEIEKMLDEVEAPDAEDEGEIEEVDLTLDMELEPELETTSEDVEAGVEPEALEEADLSDIEKMLEVKDEAQDDLEFELDLDEEPLKDALVEDDAELEILEFDGLDDVADAIEGDDLSETLEFEPDLSEEKELEEDEETADPFYVETQILDRAAMEPSEPDVKVEKAKPKPVVKKRISKPMLVLLILVLLAGLGYGAYTLLNFMNIEIPFISEYLKPEAQDPLGKLKLHTFDIESKFVDNAKIGKLFIITGKVRNDYAVKRNFIQVKGTLFTTGRKVAQTATVFSSNVISDIELSRLDLAAIKKRLANRVGDNSSNIQVNPGKVLQFMIVFAGLPDNLEEFTVEAAGSSS